MSGDFSEINPICPGFSIRPIESLAGYRRCVDLQIRIWNYGDAADVVPMAILAITNHNGGVLLGAYDACQRMVGFVYSILGFHHGHLVQHSHMLGVIPAYRSRRIGLALKLAQRKLTLRQGVKRVVWTYDPLQTRNAHFNFNLLGTWVDSYEVNMYGRSSSKLHQGLDTDRFFATWDLNAPQVKRKVRAALRGHLNPAAAPKLPVINPIRFDGGGLQCSAGMAAHPREDRFLFEVPPDINRLKAEQPAAARGFQRQLRETCLHYFPKGYHVTQFFRDTAATPPRCYYLFEKADPSADA